MGPCFTPKPLLRADDIIHQLPTPDKFARKTKLALDPTKIPDLQWDRTDLLNTPKLPKEKLK